MKDDDGLRLDEHQIAYFIRKYRAAALKDPEHAKDVIEVLQDAPRAMKNEDYETFEMARTICELLEPERLGGIISMNCSVCGKVMGFDESKEGICSQCKVTG